MPLEMFLKIDGVAGESRNFQHKGWADVVSWQWGLDRILYANQEKGVIMNMGEISLVKAVGMDSSALMEMFAEGKTVANAVLSIIPSGGKRGSQQKYVEIKLQDVFVKSISTGGDNEQNALMEDVTLGFEKVQYTYHQYPNATPDGKPGKPEYHAFGWDLESGSSLAVET